MSSAAEPCRTCDGTGYVETAEKDSRVLTYKPCPDCGSPPPAVTTSALVQALIQEHRALLPLAEAGPRGYVLGAQDALAWVASLLGVSDLHAQATEVAAREAPQLTTPAPSGLWLTAGPLLSAGPLRHDAAGTGGGVP